MALARLLWALPCPDCTLQPNLPGHQPECETPPEGRLGFPSSSEPRGVICLHHSPSVCPVTLLTCSALHVCLRVCLAALLRLCEPPMETKPCRAQVPQGLKPLQIAGLGSQITWPAQHCEPRSPERSSFPQGP